MIAEWTKEIPNWEKEYKEMMQGLLTKRQLEILNGAELTGVGHKPFDPNSHQLS